MNLRIGLGIAALAIGALAAGAAASQDITLPNRTGTVSPEIPKDGGRSSVPMRPSLMQPAANAVVGGPGAPTAQLVWNFGGISLTQYPAAQHFFICVSSANPAPPCASPGQVRLPVSSLASETYVHPVFGPQPATRVYRHSLPLGQFGTQPDRNLTWRVGACTSTGACSISDPASFYWSGRNLTRPEIQRNQISSGGVGGWGITAYTTNDGQTSTGPFSARVEVMEALIDPANGRCLTDVNHPSLQGTDQVIRSDASRSAISALPRDPMGRRLAEQVTAIVRPGNTLVLNPPSPHVVAIPDAPPRLEPVTTILGNQSFTFSWASSPASPKAGVAVVTLDPDGGGSVREFNEGDNAAARCLPAVHR
jgi:hypothetical protein